MAYDGDSMYRFHDPGVIDLDKLTIKLGDSVLYENVEYIVKAVGMRWLRVEKKDTPGVEYSLKKTQCVKIYPEAQSGTNLSP